MTQTLKFDNHFSDPQVHPFDQIQWDKRTASITDDQGQTIFEQHDVEVPRSWSVLATNIVASKYFYGRPGTDERETSVRQLITRVAKTMADWGVEGGYFDLQNGQTFERELTWLLLNQYGAFNSPVWFNCGLYQQYQTGKDSGPGNFYWNPQTQLVERAATQYEHPQCSACFIQSVDDDMDSLMDLAKSEAMLFKFGSGSGTDLSTIRSQRERMSGGGSPSGPLSFLRVYDSVASVVKSGGKCLAPHQLVYTTVGPKTVQELAERDQPFYTLSYDPPAGRMKVKKAWAWKEEAQKEVVRITTDKGVFDLSLDHPVRLADGEIRRAGELAAGVSLHAVTVGESMGYHSVGLQSGDKTKEFIHRLVAQDILGQDLTGMSVHHKDGDKFNNVPENLEVMTQSKHASLHNQEHVENGQHVFQTQKFDHVGDANGMHRDSQFWKDQEKVEAYKQKQGAILKDSGRAADMQMNATDQKMLNTAYRLINAGRDISTYEKYCEARQDIIGPIAGKRKVLKSINDRFGSYDKFLKELSEKNHRVLSVEQLGVMDVYDVEVDCPTPDDKTPESGHNFMIVDCDYQSGAIRGIVISNTRRAAKMNTLKDWHPDIKEFIEAKQHEERKAWALIDQGYSGDFNGEAYGSVCYQNENLSVRVSDEFMRAVAADADWTTHWVTDPSVEGPTYKARELMRQIAEGTWVCGDPGLQYEDTIQKWHTCSDTEPINSSNPCSEYMFLDDTSCNLASLNLTKFADARGKFDPEAFQRAVDIFITAQEIVVDQSSYPTEKIAERSHIYRTLGLGYANLGALIMSNGYSYDSEEGRALASAITALMHNRAYVQSAKMAEVLGPFPGYDNNKESMSRVVQQHHDATMILPEINGIGKVAKAAKQVAKEMLQLDNSGVGYRNAQVTVLAPTGCLTGDSLVLTSEGLLPIEDLGDTRGTQWQSLDISVMQEGGTTPATQFYVNGEDEVYEVTSVRGHQLRGTWKHKLRVVGEDGAYTWKMMQDIDEDDTLVLKLGGHQELLGDKPLVSLCPVEVLYYKDEELTLPSELDERTAEVLGYYMGDGYLKAKGGLHLVIADTDRDLDERFSEWFTKVGRTPTAEQRKGCHVLNMFGRALYRWFHVNEFAKDKGSHGEGAASAFIPEAVLRSRTSVLQAFIRGLFEADGTIGGNAKGTPVIELSTVSHTLARQLQVSLESLGMSAKVTPQESREDQIGDRRKYRVCLSSAQDCEEFSKQVGFVSLRKKEKLKEAVEVTTTIERKGGSLQHPALLLDLYESAKGLPHDVRSDIRVRLRSGTAGMPWVRRVIERNPQLQGSKVAQLLALGDVQLVKVGSSTHVGRLPTYDISVPHRNTYVANGFVSHNTIGFLMDCDTTGIEPDIALVKYKLLAGGGMLKLVNRGVPAALKNLGYSAQDIERIVDYIEENDTIEGAPVLKDEHLSIFDCAFKPRNGVRALSPMSHLKMMAAAQPFLSGAISKTCNMPQNATVEDIMGTYVEAWKLGLKAVAIYRDGSKRSQPMTTGKDEPEVDKVVVVEPRRRRLPETRQSVTHKFEVGGHEGYLTVGLYPEGQPGEVFITMAKEGSTVGGMMDAFGTSISVGLQYGVPLQTLINKFMHARFEPSGFTKNSEIPMAKSLVDYIFRWMAQQFPEKGPEVIPPVEKEAGETQQVETAQRVDQQFDHLMSDAPACDVCGSITVRNGSCYKCFNCGNSMGCS